MDSGLDEVKVHVIHKSRRHSGRPTNQSVQLAIEKRRTSKTLSRSSNYAYVNNSFTGSVTSVNTNAEVVPPTSVIREQYWTCSKWPVAQRVLVIAVGVLGGAVIGLAISVGLLGRDGPHLGAFL